MTGGFKKLSSPICFAIPALIILVMSSGCSHYPPMAVAPVQPPPGFIFQDTIAPLFIENSQVNQDNGASLAEGKAKAQFISVPFTYNLLSFGWGDDSMEAAMGDGRINELHRADVRDFNILGIYKEQEILAYGTQ